MRGIEGGQRRPEMMQRTRATRQAVRLVTLCAAALCGCTAQKPTPAPDASPLQFARPADLDDPAPVANDLDLVVGSEENVLRPSAMAPASGRRDGEKQVVKLDIALTMLHVQTPRAHLARVEKIWSYVREDAISAVEARRLQRNGMRVGIGRDESWAEIQDVLATIPGVRHVALPPVRVPPNYPLALELDREPRTQTLFHVGEDEILTGESWPDSRNVLRISYALDLARVSGVRLMVVPEVRQRREGWKWVVTDAGVAQVPHYAGRAFATAGFTVALSPGEFLVIAPNRDATAYGLLGGAFLTSEADGQRLDSLVLIRADVSNVARRD